MPAHTDAAPDAIQPGGWAAPCPGTHNAPCVWPGEQAARAPRPLIVFDLDGTLLDSYELANEGHRRAIAALGLPPVSLAVLEALNGPSAEGACHILGLPLSRQAELEAALEAADDVLIPTWARLFPGVLSMLEVLTGRATLCLLTHGQPSYLHAVCAVTGMEGFFAERAGFTPGVSKAMRIREWAQRHGAPRALMVGDRPTDLDAAREAGAVAVGVTYGAGSAQEMAGADALAHDLAQVCEICLAFCAGT